MSEPQRPDGDPLAGALALIGQQGRRLGDVERDVGTLKDDVARVDELGPRVTELAEMVAALAEDEAAGARPERAPWWPDFGPSEERTEALRALGAWVEEVIRRPASRAIPGPGAVLVSPSRCARRVDGAAGGMVRRLPGFDGVDHGGHRMARPLASGLSGSLQSSD